MKTVTLKVTGMTCANCQRRVEKALRGTVGVRSASVSYRQGTAKVVFDSERVTEAQLGEAVRGAGYGIANIGGATRALGFAVIIFALYIILQRFGLLNLLVPNRLADVSMSLGALFVLGLLTSVHCAAMCGGINLSQTVGRSGIAPSLLYNLGRVVSYTLIGAVVGAIGAAVSFTPITQGVLKLAAGVLMLLMGVNMLCILPFKISLPSLNLKSRSTAPLIVGLLNGLMPCGPLQSMQIYALSTGNALSGALAMLVFSAGTVPLMFGIGAIGNIFKRSMSRAMTVGAVLVCVMGLSMLTQGVTLSNIGGSVSVKPSAASEPRASDGVQIVESTLPVRGYPNISVSKGIPAEWTISVPDGRLNGCNYAMYIPEYGVEWQFDYGDNLIEFTPLNAGKFTYYCWMGMQRGTITVTDGGA